MAAKIHGRGDTAGKALLRSLDWLNKILESKKKKKREI